ncbi:DUF3267 domain-containing protein [Pontibacillus sp. ALD_SL1]|uniref:DUF3267 domain-containing protein n=1 Tax=Pontibacillus sp. ALD_SL1 TaxID=2777185 RepID=UPI001A96A46D|nr:DUF3267 domain-containing protein [Pontibacillus sp. ALD_SL1]QST00975.1 DUF3267 domain-containing protein [Pontibacillus sp. ALD_SL1]
MKVSTKLPVLEQFRPEEEGWTMLKEPKAALAQWLALPIGMFAIFLVYALAVVLGIEELYQFRFGWNLLLAYIVLVPIHEWLHAMVFPDKLKSDDIYVGVLRKYLVFFAFYTNEMSRNRALAVYMTPFLVLSVVPIVFMAVTGVSSLFLFDIAFLNAICSCVDLLAMIMIYNQVPKEAVVRNKGYKTYWKHQEEVVTEKSIRTHT